MGLEFVAARTGAVLFIILKKQSIPSWLPKTRANGFGQCLSLDLKLPIIFEKVPNQNGPKWAKIV